MSRQGSEPLAIAIARGIMATLALSGVQAVPKSSIPPAPARAENTPLNAAQIVNCGCAGINRLWAYSDKASEKSEGVEGEDRQDLQSGLPDRWLQAQTRFSRRTESCRRDEAG
jgi:hypothetical protein